MTGATWIRGGIGFLVAPISPGLLAVAISLIFRAASSSIGAREVSEAAWLIGLSAVLGYPTAIILGVPAYLVLKWRRWNGPLVYVMAGALLGVMVYLVFGLLPHFNSGGFGALKERLYFTADTHLPAGVLCGALAAFVFWLVARPDRSAPAEV